MFPQGGPRIALLLIRASFAVVFLVNVWMHFGASIPHWFWAFLLLVATAL